MFFSDSRPDPLTQTLLDRAEPLSKDPQPSLLPGPAEPSLYASYAKRLPSWASYTAPTPSPAATGKPLEY